MADFCKECSIEVWGKDFGDLVGISTEKNTKDELYAVVLCESCGPILVDHLGSRVTEPKKNIIYLETLEDLDKELEKGTTP